MDKIKLFDIKGFEQLNEKLKKLPDRVKRREVLKIQRRVATPVIRAYREALPKDTGNLAKSVRAVTVPIRKVDGNPAIVVRPSKRGKYNGYYRFMVIWKGARPGTILRGSRIGWNTVVEDAKKVAVSRVSAEAQREAIDKTAAYIQKQIDRLS